jgi:hypothetical protein
MTYLDNQLLEISRQHIISSLRHPIAPALEKLVDILWLSATPSLQKPYLLAIASTFDMDYIAAYPLDGSTFALLDKLDRCFYTLSEELTATEKVRVQSLVLATRLKVIRLVEGGASGIKRRPVACNHTPCAGITEDDEQNETDEDKDEDGSSIQHTSEEESEEDLELRFEISQVYHRYVPTPSQKISID